MVQKGIDRGGFLRCGPESGQGCTLALQQEAGFGQFAEFDRRRSSSRLGSQRCVDNVVALPRMSFDQPLARKEMHAFPH